MKQQRQSYYCPITEMLRLVSAKWTVEILREVSIRPTRTRQFLAWIPGLSMKCLQERLKELEAAGMIERKKYDERVPRVEHSITDRGKKLLSILLDLKELSAEIAAHDCQCPMETVACGLESLEARCPGRADAPMRSSRRENCVVETRKQEA